MYARRKEENETNIKENQGQESVWFRRAKEQCKKKLPSFLLAFKFLGPRLL